MGSVPGQETCQVLGRAEGEPGLTFCEQVCTAPSACRSVGESVCWRVGVTAVISIPGRCPTPSARLSRPVRALHAPDIRPDVTETTEAAGSGYVRCSLLNLGRRFCVPDGSNGRWRGVARTGYGGGHSPGRGGPPRCGRYLDLSGMDFPFVAVWQIQTVGARRASMNRRSNSADSSLGASPR